MADDLSMADRHPRHVAGLDVDDRSRNELSNYLAGNPQRQGGRIVYDLRERLRIGSGRAPEHFAFYFDAFPQVRTEVH